MRDRGLKLEANVWIIVDTEKIDRRKLQNTKKVISKSEV